MTSDLERIERYARHVLNNAISCRAAVRQLKGQPDFETIAEETMRIAQDQLEVSLAELQEALSDYSKKPVTA